MYDAAHDAAPRAKEVPARLAADQCSKDIPNASRAGGRSTGTASLCNRGNDSHSSSLSAIIIRRSTAAQNCKSKAENCVKGKRNAGARSEA